MNSLGFDQAVSREQSNQAREKNAHQTCGEARWPSTFYKLLTRTRLENSNVGTKKKLYLGF